MSNNLFGNFLTETFSDIYPSFTEFNDDYENLGIPKTLKSSTTLNTIYLLLYSKYGNSNILNMDRNQFRFQVFSIIYQYGATWERKIEIQENFRKLQESDIVVSSKQIINHAYNPNTPPSTQALEELQQINEQTTSGFKKNKIDAYSLLYDVLKDDFTDDFIRKFKNLFLKIVMPYKPLWYVSYKEED